MRFLRFSQWLDQFELVPGGQVYFEEVRAHRGTDAAHIYGGLMAILQQWCDLHSVPYQGVPVGTIKRHATGKGNASKQMVINAVTTLGHSPDDDNEADAIALYHYILSQPSCIHHSHHGSHPLASSDPPAPTSFSS